eukprot:753837-Hanusia_phi.AAC.7
MAKSSQHNSTTQGQRFWLFSHMRDFLSRYAILELEDFLLYFPFARDFGPVNLSCVIHFCEALTRTLNCHNSKTVLLKAPPTPPSITNAAFLLGSYEVSKPVRSFGHVHHQILSQSSFRDESFLSCESIPAALLLPYRDATHLAPSFGLALKEVLGGLEKALVCTSAAREPKADGTAQNQGWLDGFMTSRDELEEYEHYDDPYNGDAHVIIPNKLLALKVFACSEASSRDVLPL